ncbi:ROK family protein [Acholeplasma vituli]|uniref:ROK family protein n=1 Tax=Paracholeplasma vituli TaxID=69473 RepID=A0ABT2PTH9_9MOLU|nr:ROK family protein [Paracholeplasma vituli]MCU0104263.1 ROK family protein [Paracholeplasma vituli]
MRQFFVFDIGGTDIKYGVITQYGELIHKAMMPSRGALGGKFIIEDIIQAVNQMKDSFKGEGIAVSSAGVISSQTGELLSATNAILDFIGLNIIEELQSALHLPVSVMNDVNSMALCEYHMGAGRNASSMIALTVGTGIGGAIVLNGHLIEGNGFSAGEFGLMQIEGEVYEQIASTSSLVRAAKKQISSDIDNGVAVFKLFDEGHPGAIEVVNRFYQNLSIGIANIAYAFNPEIIVIGGGITARPSFIEELKSHVLPRLSDHLIKYTTLKAAQYKNDAGMVGAFYHFLNRYPNFK